MIRLAFVAPAMALVACAPVAPVEAPPAETHPVGDGTCNNAPLAQFAGRARSEALGAEILRVSGARSIQWIGHGQMVTMEYRADRVRVQLTKAGTVEAARCG